MTRLTITKEGVPGKTVIEWKQGETGYASVDLGGTYGGSFGVQDFPAWCYDNHVPLDKLMAEKTIELRGSVLVLEET